jgi:hypothetical protein
MGLPGPGFILCGSRGGSSLVYNLSKNAALRVPLATVKVFRTFLSRIIAGHADHSHSGTHEPKADDIFLETCLI